MVKAGYEGNEDMGYNCLLLYCPVTDHMPTVNGDVCVCVCVCVWVGG